MYIVISNFKQDFLSDKNIVSIFYILVHFLFFWSKKALFWTFASAGFWYLFWKMCRKVVETCSSTHSSFLSGEMRQIVKLLNNSTNNYSIFHAFLQKIVILLKNSTNNYSIFEAFLWKSLHFFWRALKILRPCISLLSAQKVLKSAHVFVQI